MYCILIFIGSYFIQISKIEIQLQIINKELAQMRKLENELSEISIKKVDIFSKYPEVPKNETKNVINEPKISSKKPTVSSKGLKDSDSTKTTELQEHQFDSIRERFEYRKELLIKRCKYLQGKLKYSAKKTRRNFVFGNKFHKLVACVVAKVIVIGAFWLSY